MKAATRKLCKLGTFGKFQSTPPVKAATYLFYYIVLSYRFQSTPPVKAATYALMLDVARHFISIHAAREGGDCKGTVGCAKANHFNPRRP